MSKKTHARAPQGRPPSGKGEDRRERILDSAVALFARQGVAGTTVAAIAKDSGVTPAMVHYYFGNRDGLLDALAAERLAPEIAYIWAGVLEAGHGDPRRVVTEFVDRLLEVIGHMPQLPLLWSREVLNAGGLLRARLAAALPVDAFEAVRRFFDEARQKGTFNADADPALVVISAVGAVMVPLAAQGILDKFPSVPALDGPLIRRHALALLLDGLCPEKTPEELP